MTYPPLPGGSESSQLRGRNYARSIEHYWYWRRRMGSTNTNWFMAGRGGVCGSSGSITQLQLIPAPDKGFARDG
jgi:hypothetical protein